jgi:hypothetical protein
MWKLLKFCNKKYQFCGLKDVKSVLELLSVIENKKGRNMVVFFEV